MANEDRMPVSHSSAVGSKSMCRNRFAIGGVRSTPPALRSGGLAAATIRTSSGSLVRPTIRSNATVSIAACTDAEHVEISSSRR